MTKVISKYIAVLFIFGIFFLFFVSVIFLPSITNKYDTLYLPDVRNLNIVKAEKVLSNLNFKVESAISNYNKNYLPGDVVSMIPRAYTKVKKGRTIKLMIAGKKKDVMLQDFINSSLRNVKISLNKSNIIVDTLIYEYSNLIKKDFIIDQYPNKNTLMKSFDEITLIVSLGNPPDYYIVPSLTNVNLKRAKTIISKAGLKIGKISYEYNPNILNNTIVEQSLTAGMKLSFPHSIDIIITTDRIKVNE